MHLNDWLMFRWRLFVGLAEVGVKGGGGGAIYVFFYVKVGLVIVAMCTFIRSPFSCPYDRPVSESDG